MGSNTGTGTHVSRAPRQEQEHMSFIDHDKTLVKCYESLRLVFTKTHDHISFTFKSKFDIVLIEMERFCHTDGGRLRVSG